MASTRATRLNLGVPALVVMWMLLVVVLAIVGCGGNTGCRSVLGCTFEYTPTPAPSLVPAATR